MSYTIGQTKAALAKIIASGGKPVKPVKPATFGAGTAWQTYAAQTTSVTPVVTGGGGSGNHHHGNGGGNSNNHGGNKMSLKVIMGIFLLICTALSSLSMVYMSVARTSDKGVALQIEELKTDRKKYDAEIAKATGAFPSGWNQVEAGSGGGSGQAVQASPNKQIIRTEKNFSCPSVDSTENGFAKRNIEYINASTQSFRVSAGCVLVVVQGTISKMEGKRYRLSIPEPSQPGSFWNCGDMGGSNDADCTGFVNYWSGKEMRIALLNGGYVNF